MGEVRCKSEGMAGRGGACRRRRGTSPPKVFTPDPAFAFFKINICRNSLPQILLLPISRSTSVGIIDPKSCSRLFQDQRPLEFFTSDPAFAFFKINVCRNFLPLILLLPFSRSTSAGIIDPKSCFRLFQDQRPPEVFTSNLAFAFFKINVRRNSLPQILLPPFSG